MWPEHNALYKTLGDFVENAKQGFQENVSSNIDTKYASMLVETNHSSKLDQSTANILELIRVLENIEVTPEHLRDNAWGGHFKEDGAAFIY